MKAFDVCCARRRGERLSEMMDDTPPKALAILIEPFTGWTWIAVSRYTGKWSLPATNDTQIGGVDVGRNRHQAR